MRNVRRRCTSIIALLVVVALGSGCGDNAPVLPDVVVITLDTLRADHVSVYGGLADTPSIDGLATDGMLFERVVAPLPETRPSHATLMTSQYPRHHGLVSNSHSLSDEALSVAEVYRSAGYQTGAFVGCALFSPESGLQQGFDHFADSAEPQRPSHEVVPLAREWLADVEPHRPFFMWLHLFDPHMPYEPPNPSPASPGEAGLDEFTWPILMAAARRNEGNVPAPLLRRARTLYRDEVEHMDGQLGLILADLRTRPNWSSTIVVATADHGECFENGIFFDHSYCLGEGALAVPLVLRAEGVERGRRSRAVVELLDVAPTLLRLSGIEVPSAFAGRGLLARASGPPSDAFFQHPFYQSDALAGRAKVFETLRSVAGEPVRPVSGEQLQAGVRRRQLKLVVHGDDSVLFDLDEDPREANDITTERSELSTELLSALRAWLGSKPLEVADPSTINPELREQLEALGYL